MLLRMSTRDSVPLILKAKTHCVTNCCDTSLRQVAATNHLVWHVKIFVAVTEFCQCNLSHEFKLVWIRATYCSDKIGPSRFFTVCVRFCNKSLRQNLNQPMREHQLFSHHLSENHSKWRPNMWNKINNLSNPRILPLHGGWNVTSRIFFWCAYILRYLTASLTELKASFCLTFAVFAGRPC